MASAAAASNQPQPVGTLYVCANAPDVHFTLSPELYALLRSKDTTCRDGSGGGIIICANVPITAAAYTAATSNACELQVWLLRDSHLHCGCIVHPATPGFGSMHVVPCF